MRIFDQKRQKLDRKIVEAGAKADFRTLSKNDLKIYTGAAKREFLRVTACELEFIPDSTAFLSEAADKFTKQKAVISESKGGCCDKLRQCFSSMFSCGKKDEGDLKEDDCRILGSPEL